MSKVKVNPVVLKWAIDRSFKTTGNLQPKFPKIQQWIDGESEPTLRQLESLAKATFTPLGYFFLDESPEEPLPIPYYRTQDDGITYRPSPDLIESIRMMERRQSWMREFLIEQGQERLSFVKSVQINDQPLFIAQEIRGLLGFDEEWAAKQPTWSDALRVLRDAIENAGVLVVVNGIVGNNTHRKLDPGEFRGFVLVDDYAPLMFVNGADGKAAQMFTLAHELAHIFLGSGAAFDLREMKPAKNRIEQLCNRVAAEFLVPEEKIRRIWPSIPRDADPFQYMAQKFKVSRLVAARRVLDLGMIQKTEFLDFYNDYLGEERTKSGERSQGGDFFKTQFMRIGRRFTYAVVQAAREGKVLYSEAYKLTGLYGKTFDKYVSSLKILGN